MPQIIAAQQFCSNQSAGPVYTGIKFKYCPWCGKILDPIQGLADLLGNMPGSQEDWDALIDDPYY